MENKVAIFQGPAKHPSVDEVLRGVSEIVQKPAENLRQNLNKLSDCLLVKQVILSFGVKY
jgi:hypothetical protein